MGLFDSVFLECPWCHKVHEEQVKEGPSYPQMERYALNENAGLTLALSEAGAFNCEHCKQSIIVSLMVKPVAVPLKNFRCEQKN